MEAILSSFKRSEKSGAGHMLLHHFYDPFPTVLHYELTNGPGMAATKAD